jgi:hypothetical protein
MKDSYNIIRFDKSSYELKNEADGVLSFSNGVLCYSREINTNGEISVWFKTNPPINN